MEEKRCENYHETNAFVPLERSATSAIGKACGVEGQTSDTMKPHLIQVKIFLYQNYSRNSTHPKDSASVNS